MATCEVTLNIGYGADAPQARGVVKINRIERGDDGDMIVTVGQQEIPMVYPFPAVELEQGVTYRFVESWTGGITRYCTIPLAATADYSDLTDVTPVPPAYAGVLTDALVSAEVDENGDLIVTHLDASTTNAGHVVGAPGGSDESFAEFVGDPNSLTGQALTAKIDDAVAGKADADTTLTLGEDTNTVMLDSGSVTTLTTIPFHSAPFSCRLDQIVFAFGDAIAADNTDYWSVSLTRYRSGAPALLATKTTRSAANGEPIAAWQPWSFDAIDLASDEIREGDVLVVTMAPSGSPDPLVSPVVTFRLPPADFPAPIVGAFDDFTRLDGAGLGTAYSGQKWQTLSGGWEISSNTAKPTGTNARAALDANLTACTIEVEIPTFSSGSGTFGVVLHASDASNNYNTSRTALFRLEGGTSTNIAAFSQTLGAGDGLRVVTDGEGTITVYRDAGLTGSWTQIGQATGQTFNLGATMHGLRSSANPPSGVAFDNFSVTP